MGAFTVPIVDRKPWGIICLVMNVLLPGTGSLVAAGNMEDLRTFVIGVLQILLFWTLIVWLWSIVWGVLILLRSE